MKVYLVRHGEALPPDIDSSRPLSDQGRSDVDHVARTLENMNLRVGTIYHSDKLRAEETARIIAERIQPEDGIRRTVGLLPNDEVDDALELIEASEEDLMLVSHLPLLDHLLAALVKPAEGEDLPGFDAGAMVGVEKLGDGWKVFRKLGPHMIY